jgi:hypothetical protein
MLSKEDIEQFVAKQGLASFQWGEETIPPEKLASLIEMLGVLPCKDCKRFFESLEGALTHPIVRKELDTKPRRD